MDPPKLNIEISDNPRLEAVVKRDSRIAAKQERVAAGLGGVLKLTALTLSLEAESPAKLEMITVLSALLRVLADFQHEETSVRRALVLKNIKQTMRKTLSSTEPDNWLFGKELAEKITKAKSLIASSELVAEKNQANVRDQAKNLRGPLYRRNNNNNNHRTPKFSNTTSSGQRNTPTQNQRHRTTPPPARKTSYPRKRD